MATDTYLIGRKVYKRPQALCFADNPGTEQNGIIVPDGTEFSNFIILSDHNRSGINIAPDRIGSRKRAINGRMRAYWIADKLTISVSWKDLPSRGWPVGVQINEDSDTRTDPTRQRGVNLADYSDRFTVDGGAGGNELLQWYRGYQDSFWVYLAYDRYPTMGAYDKLGQYNEVVEMFFSDFSYDVNKRGGTNMDLWDVDLKLEEV